MYKSYALFALVAFACFVNLGHAGPTDILPVPSEDEIELAVLDDLEHVKEDEDGAVLPAGGHIVGLDGSEPAEPNEEPEDEDEEEESVLSENKPLSRVRRAFRCGNMDLNGCIRWCRARKCSNYQCSRYGCRCFGC